MHVCAHVYVNSCYSDYFHVWWNSIWKLCLHLTEHRTKWPVCMDCTSASQLLGSYCPNRTNHPVTSLGMTLQKWCMNKWFHWWNRFIKQKKRFLFNHVPNGLLKYLPFCDLYMNDNSLISIYFNADLLLFMYKGNKIKL